MWYVIQVLEGNTESALNKCKNAFPKNAYKEMFIPMYECMHKNAGKWYIIRKELFSGYFFVDSDHGEAIFECMKRIGRFAKPVCVGADFVPITQAEQNMLNSLLNSEKVIIMSRGNIINGEFEIFEGPLQGKGGLIRKIDRHKRIGNIDVSILGEVKRVMVGLEIISKTDRKEEIA